jgi:hypothetical protein
VTIGSCCGAAEDLQPGDPDLWISVARHGLGSLGTWR